MLLRLAYKNIIARKSSIVIILFIAFAIMLLVVTNSVFDSTERGIEETFIHSFTGDIVIRPKNDVSFCLFGDETPVTGKLTTINTLTPYTEIMETIKASNDIKSSFSQLSASVLIESKAARFPIYLFGADGESYLKTMTALSLIEGEPYKNGEKGVMLSDVVAKKLNLSVGDSVQFTVSDGASFRIRAADVKAIYSYGVENSTLENIAIADSKTVCSLLDMNAMVYDENIDLTEEQEALFSESFDDESLFFDAEDVDAVFNDDFEKLEEVNDNSIVHECDTDANSAESLSWNFIVCSLKDSNNTKDNIKSLNKIFKEKNWPIEAVGWRAAAGNTAMYLYWMRIILNVGILVILFAGFIVVNNTLVINILDRSREIGTMRAIGASRAYVCAMCFSETFILAVISGILGCILGVVMAFFVKNMNITFSNEFLIQLFGGNKLITHITFSNLFNSFLLSLFLGFLAWIYPVQTALQANPVQAMQGAK
ncbi:MAG: FtsX-like permease family protein [Treponema sp.]|nr:FtsX-like permease family protein [Treponema sp.]